VANVETNVFTLTLVVVRCRDLEQSRRFYEALGLSFNTERHGAGPVHYSTRLGTTVLELYPAGAAPSNVRLGVGVANVATAVDSVRAVGCRVDRAPTAQDVMFVIQTTMRLS
jgi:lactoylglutathione lyase